MAKLIKLRDTTGVKRQVFFCSIGGFDTHSAQSWAQWDLLRQVSAAVSAVGHLAEAGPDVPAGAQAAVVKPTGALAATWPPPGDAGQKPAPAVVRGGSFYTTADGADATRRYPLLANQAYSYLGFRCLDGVSLEQLHSALGAQ